MEVGFRFEVIHSDEDLLKIRVAAWNGNFGGAADLYVGVGQLEKVCEKIQSFPRNASDTREFTLGSFSPQRAGGGLNMRFYCADRAGHAYIDAIIEEETWSGQQQLVQSVTIRNYVSAD